jgi:hypothetical protein
LHWEQRIAGSIKLDLLQLGGCKPCCCRRCCCRCCCILVCNVIALLGLPLGLRASPIAAADNTLRVWAQPELLLLLLLLVVVVELLLVHVSMLCVILGVGWMVLVLLCGLWDLAGL